jgi:hypothetical protein
MVFNGIHGISISAGDSLTLEGQISRADGLNGLTPDSGSTRL